MSPGGVGGGTAGEQRPGSIWIPDLTRSVRKLPFLRRPEVELSFICVRGTRGRVFGRDWTFLLSTRISVSTWAGAKLLAVVFKFVLGGERFLGAMDVEEGGAGAVERCFDVYGIDT